MALGYYRGLLVQDEADGPGADFGMVFPDLPGCTSQGATAFEAAKQAADALAGHIALMVEAGEALPNPSEVGSALPDWLEDAGRVVGEVLVPVEMPGRVVRANVSMDEALLRQVDIAAKNEGTTRSAFLAEAAKALFWSRKRDWATKRAADLRHELELLQSGKMQSSENHGQGKIDTTDRRISQINRWLADLDGLPYMEGGRAKQRQAPKHATVDSTPTYVTEHIRHRPSLSVKSPKRRSPSRDTAPCPAPPKP